MSKIFDMEMSMSFREKSAWVMGLLMTFLGAYYLSKVLEASREVGWTAPPSGVFAPYALMVVIASILAQVTLACLSPKEADAPADERERPLIDRAGNWAGFVLGGGAIGALFNYLVHGNGDLLFHLIVGSLILSQIAEYAFQIALFRRSA